MDTTQQAATASKLLALTEGTPSNLPEIFHVHGAARTVKVAVRTDGIELATGYVGNHARPSTDEYETLPAGLTYAEIAAHIRRVADEREVEPLGQLLSWRLAC